jgi:hypothetical protein
VAALNLSFPFGPSHELNKIKFNSRKDAITKVATKISKLTKIILKNL